MAVKNNPTNKKSPIIVSKDGGESMKDLFEIKIEAGVPTTTYHVVAKNINIALNEVLKLANIDYDKKIVAEDIRSITNLGEVHVIEK